MDFYSVNPLGFINIVVFFFMISLFDFQFLRNRDLSSIKNSIERVLFLFQKLKVRNAFVEHITHTAQRRICGAAAQQGFEGGRRSLSSLACGVHIHPGSHQSSRDTMLLHLFSFPSTSNVCPPSPHLP